MTASAAGMRGAPLAMLAVLLAGWGTARAVLWENPFAPLAEALDLPRLAASASQIPLAPQAVLPAVLPLERAGAGVLPLSLAAFGGRGLGTRRSGGFDPRMAAAHNLLWFAAFRQPLRTDALIAASEADLHPGLGPSGEPAPFLAASPSLRGAGRWTVDGWAFWRQGSDGAPVSQGRVPIYGASQAGAILQYRIAPGSARDPRLYARAYRALVRRGESELALGASARPFGRVPLRVAGEVRYTDTAFSDTFRPAAYVVTELAPAPLPFGGRLEAYGQAGWVGGPDPTAFADGQASVTGEVRQIAGLTDNAVRLSLGAAAWGGAQKDAQRIDIGPTVRLDVTLGEVPARFSVDWRERVGGDAGPDSGVAATLSTSF